jgi:hypothetical protein
VIAHKDLYLRFIAAHGVGANDAVASSPKSYVSYLNSVSRLINAEITPRVLRSEDDIAGILLQIGGKRADSTLRNYRSAMRQYVAMVEADGL